MKKKVIALFLSLVTVASVLTGCTGGQATVSSEDLEERIIEDEITFDLGYTNFSLNLLQEVNKENQNVMVSPISVAVALNLLAQAAKGDTYDEIASVLGVTTDKDSLAAYYSAFSKRMNSDPKLHVANSLWVSEPWLSGANTTIGKDYDSNLKKYFGVESNACDLTDSKTVDLVNKWVSKNTSGMIDKIVEEFTPDDLVVLINAVSFEKEWAEKYEKTSVNENAEFINSLGEAEYGKAMFGEEDFYFENEAATGFLKLYKGDEYGFLGILPNDDEISLGDFMQEFDENSYREFWQSKSKEAVDTLIPAFAYDFEEELAMELQNMGMKSAFEETADLSGMFENGTKDIHVGMVVHKTHIEVDEQGTKAAAATMVTVKTNGLEISENKSVFLNRPFLYAIVDVKTGNPIFIGTVNSIKN